MVGRDIIRGEGRVVSKWDTISLRIDPKLRERAGKIFEELGLTTEEAVTLFLRQVVLRRGLPFDIRLPEEGNEAEDPFALDDQFNNFDFR